VNKAFRFALMCVAGLAVTAVPAFASRVVTAPEPTSFLLLASGIGSIVLLRRVRK
jgi:hypothetical protein